MWLLTLLLAVLLASTPTLTPTPPASLFDRLIERAPTLQAGEACVTLEGDLINVAAEVPHLLPVWTGEPVYVMVQPDPFDGADAPFNNRSVVMRLFAARAEALNQAFPVAVSVSVFNMLAPQFVFGVENANRLPIDSSYPRSANQPSADARIYTLSDRIRNRNDGLDSRNASGEVYFWVTDDGYDGMCWVAFQFRVESWDGSVITATGAAAAALTLDVTSAPSATPTAPEDMPLIADCESTLLVS